MTSMVRRAEVFLSNEQPERDRNDHEDGHEVVRSETEQQAESRGDRQPPAERPVRLVIERPEEKRKTGKGQPVVQRKAGPRRVQRVCANEAYTSPAHSDARTTQSQPVLQQPKREVAGDEPLREHDEAVGKPTWQDGEKPYVDVRVAAHRHLIKTSDGQRIPRRLQVRRVRCAQRHAGGQGTVRVVMDPHVRVGAQPEVRKRKPRGPDQEENGNRAASARQRAHHGWESHRLATSTSPTTTNPMPAHRITLMDPPTRSVLKRAVRQRAPPRGLHHPERRPSRTAASSAAPMPGRHDMGHSSACGNGTLMSNPGASKARARNEQIGHVQDPRRSMRPEGAPRDNRAPTMDWIDQKRTGACHE